ncbi:energy-coupling factor transporter transmembrane protein EcfT [Microbacterium sp. cf332]|uniref:energy-coupling factor transporter transmembrane component T family protein n=1 Tax=Microbacterium sp. cf332 TaxID=1761804 RepID=UPI00088A2594|nr:energy-coupling factor transporter transmembrane protein EcfT [Microbacterium sp. cf332]SDQ75380.1 biotin transport system permease protein [Microbacterium sp. cf332]
MLTLHRPGSRGWHRLPPAPKSVLLLAMVMTVSLLPARPENAAASAAVCLACYAVPGTGWRELARQAWALRWLVVVALAGQAVFLGIEPALIGTVRIVVAVLLASLLALTTPVTALLDLFERALRPARLLGADAERIALLLVVALGAVPTLGRIARDVRDAHRARGAGHGIRSSALAFIVLALKHADDLGDALTARGVR